ncbi:hypothetical protein A9179_11395 [Pseudomonas alcaligenes]|uniref:Uncharacterized protein n=1 Tax=Aquipseudomonas alcaligenes TaxID=43263 RepID=A0ABR7S1H5_AQUAC|nr:hypothetical protein [Pseudomonas alcaligenes]
MLTLRLFSEKERKWHGGETCWQAVQVFLFEHIGHRLIFRRDDTPGASAYGEQVEFDALMSKWPGSTR